MTLVKNEIIPNDPDHPYITFDASAAPGGALTITVDTDDPVWFTNAYSNYYLKSTLDDYIILYPTEVTRWHPFKLMIINC